MKKKAFKALFSDYRAAIKDIDQDGFYQVQRIEGKLRELGFEFAEGVYPFADVGDAYNWNWFWADNHAGGSAIAYQNGKYG